MKHWYQRPIPGHNQNSQIHWALKTGKALIYGFQSSIGTTADGALGPKSLAKMPTLTKGSAAEEQVRILQCALTCNRYPVSEINGVYDQQRLDSS